MDGPEMKDKKEVQMNKKNKDHEKSESSHPSNEK